MSIRFFRSTVLVLFALAVLGQSSAWGYDVWKSRDFNWWEFEEFADPLPMASEGHTEGPGKNSDIAIAYPNGYPVIARAEVVESRYECGQYITDIEIYVDQFDGSDWSTSLVDTIAGEPVGCPNADAAQEAHLFDLNVGAMFNGQPVVLYAFGRYRSTAPDYYYGVRAACKTTSGWDLLDLKSITGNAQEVYPGSRGKASVSLDWLTFAWVLTRGIYSGTGYDSVIGVASCATIDTTNGFGTHSYGWQDEINYNPRRTYIPRAELVNAQTNGGHLVFAYTPTTSDNTTTLYRVDAHDPDAEPVAILTESGINNCSTLVAHEMAGAPYVAYSMASDKLIQLNFWMPETQGYSYPVATIPQTYSEGVCSDMTVVDGIPILTCNKGLVKKYVDGAWEYEQMWCWEADSASPSVPTVDTGGSSIAYYCNYEPWVTDEDYLVVLGNRPTDLNGGKTLSVAAWAELFTMSNADEWSDMDWWGPDWNMDGDIFEGHAGTIASVWWNTTNNTNTPYGWDAAAQPGMASCANETVTVTLYREAGATDVVVVQDTAVPLGCRIKHFYVNDEIPFDAQGNLYDYYWRVEINHDATFCSGTQDVFIETSPFQMHPQYPNFTIGGVQASAAETDSNQTLNYTVTPTHAYHHVMNKQFYLFGTGAHPATVGTDIVLVGNGQMSWPIRNTDVKPQQLTLTGDNTPEYDEQFRVALQEGLSSLYTTSILDDDRVLQVRFQQPETSLFTPGPLTVTVPAEVYCNLSGYPYGAFSVTANLVSDPHSIVDWLSNTTSGTSGVTSCTLNFNAGTGGTTQTKNAYVRLKQMQLGLHIAGIVLQNPTNGVTLGSPSGHVITVCTEE